MKKKELIKTIPLAGTEKGIITIARVEEPYGPGTPPVVSIGISLKGDPDNPDWKVHIPYENLPQVIEALKEEYERHKGNA